MLSVLKMYLVGLICLMVVLSCTSPGQCGDGERIKIVLDPCDTKVIQPRGYRYREYGGYDTVGGGLGRGGYGGYDRYGSVGTIGTVGRHHGHLHERWRRQAVPDNRV